MLNQVKMGQPFTDRFIPLPSACIPGMPILVGTLPGVVKNGYDSATGGGVVEFSGSFALTVIAATVVSPITGAAVNPGDKIYATGTTDPTTNVTYNLTLSKATGGMLFGNLDQAASLAAGTTGTVSVELLR